VRGLCKNSLGGTLFHDSTQVSHRYSVGNVLHHAKVVRNKQIRHSGLLAQFLQQIQYLVLG
jgi:hypothetical protein